MSSLRNSREQWNNRHRDRELGDLPACEVLEKYTHLLPKQGTALDLACGLGRNAIWLAQQGLQCDAIDISDVALARLSTYAKEHNLTINTHCADIESDGLGHKQYDVIVVSYFLYRPLLNAIGRALKPGGLLFYQTFVKSAGAERIETSDHRPLNADFYLAKNELRTQFQQFEIHYYQETGFDQPTNKASVAMLVATKRYDNNTI